VASRRAFLRDAGRLGGGVLLAAGVGGAGVGWWTTRSAALTGNDLVDSLLPSPPFVPFEAEFRTPPVLAPTRVEDDADYYEMTMRPAVVEILPGHSTTIWGFNGQFPGPTIRARRGRRVVVRQANQLPDAKPAIHLHGGHVEARFDGYPTDVIPVGATRDYVYPNRQLAAPLLYHDHEMDRTGLNVYMGLVGAYLLEDDEEPALNLPSGDYDVPVLIQDRAFDVDGSLRYTPEMDGMFGDVILVNGVPQPRFAVANRKYRLRIYNASNARTYELTLSSGKPLIQIGTDGGLLPAPVPRTIIPLLPFERADVIVDFSSVDVGSQVILQNGRTVGRTAAIMRFDVERREKDPSTVPSALRAFERLDEKSATVTRDFTLGMDMGGEKMRWVLNNQAFDHHRVDFAPRLGETEIWRLTNKSGGHPHPMHVHLDMFQILDRNGAPPGPGEVGWKDTVAIGPDEMVRIIIRFTDYTGRYMFHCHNLEHEDNGMMAQFDVTP
jgi:FtsP/CotA-like multicopper oxidase with cupredoxin domain